MPIDNNWVENQIRPWVVGRSNWLFAGSSTIMSLIRSAQLNGLEPLTYLKDVLTRLPTHKANDIDSLLPHRWQPLSAAA